MLLRTQRPKGLSWRPYCVNDGPDTDHDGRNNDDKTDERLDDGNGRIVISLPN